jgi:tetratricopeptide (TPR) repeat protein
MLYAVPKPNVIFRRRPKILIKLRASAVWRWSVLPIRMQRQIGWHKVNPNRDAAFSEIDVLKKAEDEVRKAISFIEEGNHIVLIDAWSEMGALCREQGNYFKAAAHLDQTGATDNQSAEYFNNSIKYFNNSIGLARAINNDYAVGEAYHGIGLTYSFKEDYQRALEYAEKAIEVADAVPSTYIKGRAQRTIATISWRLTDDYQYEPALRLAVESFNNIMALAHAGYGKTAFVQAFGRQQERSKWLPITVPMTGVKREEDLIRSLSQQLWPEDPSRHPKATSNTPLDHLLFYFDFDQPLLILTGDQTV